ncbi:OmpH family outer membrane protein [Vibrio sp.]|nr:OmpH family outer membrane protein [Vibrio sp.]
MKKLIKAASISVVLLGSSLLAHAAEAVQKIGYINAQQIFAALPQREDVMKKLRQEFQDKQDELKKIEAKAQTKIEKLKRDGELMSNDEREALRIEVSQLESEYQIKGKTLQNASKKREQEETQKLLKVIQEAVDRVAEKENFDLVLNAQAITFAKPEFDISQKVIEELK